MHVTRIGRDSEPGPPQWFTGSVWMEKIAEPSDASPVAVFRVRFSPGARTAWHAHPAGQVLHVLDGVGLVQHRGGEPQEIRAGDTVWTGAGEWHWHGAGPRTFMTHLAVQQAVDGVTSEWAEHVITEYPD
jgi:quercetin dioxygenase-like cupin family protein